MTLRRRPTFKPPAAEPEPAPAPAPVLEQPPARPLSWAERLEADRTAGHPRDAYPDPLCLQASAPKRPDLTHRRRPVYGPQDDVRARRRAAYLSGRDQSPWAALARLADGSAPLAVVQDEPGTPGGAPRATPTSDGPAPVVVVQATRRWAPR